MRQRRQTLKLKVGEAGFENHVGGDVEFNRILPEREFVEEMPCRNGEPVVGVVKLVRPIKLCVPADQLMHSRAAESGYGETRPERRSRPSLARRCRGRIERRGDCRWFGEFRKG